MSIIILLYDVKTGALLTPSSSALYLTDCTILTLRHYCLLYHPCVPPHCVALLPCASTCYWHRGGARTAATGDSGRRNTTHCTPYCLHYQYGHNYLCILVSNINKYIAKFLNFYHLVKIFNVV